MAIFKISQSFQIRKFIHTILTDPTLLWKRKKILDKIKNREVRDFCTKTATLFIKTCHWFDDVANYNEMLINTNYRNHVTKTIEISQGDLI